MPEKPQTRSNHARLDPSFHLILIPGLALLLIGTVLYVLKRPYPSSVALLLLTAFLLLAAFKARIYALKVQDRVIRLEERLRLATLAPPALQNRIGQLTESQLIALRFASDSEVAALAQRALDEKLTSKQIKDSIEVWRPDYWRV